MLAPRRERRGSGCPTGSARLSSGIDSSLSSQDTVSGNWASGPLRCTCWCCVALFRCATRWPRSNCHVARANSSPAGDREWGPSSHEPTNPDSVLSRPTARLPQARDFIEDTRPTSLPDKFCRDPWSKRTGAGSGERYSRAPRLARTSAANPGSNEALPASKAAGRRQGGACAGAARTAPWANDCHTRTLACQRGRGPAR